MTKKTRFKNYVEWYDRPEKGALALREYLLSILPYEVVIDDDKNWNYKDWDLRDVGEMTVDKWSAFADYDDIAYYFFKSEVDAMAFKLRFS